MIRPVGGGGFGRSIAGVVATENISSYFARKGWLYSAQKRLTIGDGVTVNIIFDATACATLKYLEFLGATVKAAAAGPLNVDIYSDAEYTGGTPIQGFNRNTEIGTLPLVTLTLNPTITVPGTKFPSEDQVHSNGVAATATVAGNSTFAAESILTRGTVYRLVIENLDATNDALVVVGMSWHEIP